MIKHHVAHQMNIFVLGLYNKSCALILHATFLLSEMRKLQWEIAF